MRENKTEADPGQVQPLVKPALDNYVAWCRYKKYGGATIIKTCDSDAPGAFKVYRKNDLHWAEMFCGYLIDSHEGDIISEENIRQMMVDFCNAYGIKKPETVEWHGIPGGA